MIKASSEKRIQDLHYERDELYSRWLRCSNFIKALSDVSDNYDKLCDCGNCVGEESNHREIGDHDCDCMTIKCRIDEHYALHGQKIKIGGK